MSRLFSFDSLITPSIIKFLFYIGVAISVISALGVIGSGLKVMDYSFMLGFSYIIGGLLITVIGIVVSRVAAELILVLFMIRDELAWQRQGTQSGKPGLSSVAAE